MTLNRSQVLFLALIVGSVLVGVYDAMVFWLDIEPTSLVSRLWPFIFVVLLVMWLEEDSKGRAVIYRPFEFGYLLFLLWLPYLPYYFWRTRQLKGLALLAVVLMLGAFSQLLTWGIYLVSD